MSDSPVLREPGSGTREQFMRQLAPQRMERRLRLILHRDKYRSPLIRHFLAFCRQWHGRATAGSD